MAKTRNKLFDSADVKRLEFTLDELIRMCDHLQKENGRLRSEQMGLRSERTVLIKRNEISRNKMESIIMRLKSMELEI